MSPSVLYTMSCLTVSQLSGLSCLLQTDLLLQVPVPVNIIPVGPWRNPETEKLCLLCPQSYKMVPGVTGVILIILRNSDFIEVVVVTDNIAAAQVAVVLVSLQTLPARVGHVTEGIGPARWVSYSE